jgi:hypothetical protein
MPLTARGFQQSNVTPEGITPPQRILAAGFSAVSGGESIESGPSDPESALADLIIDRGVPDLGHRRQLLGALGIKRQVGVGIASGPWITDFTIDSANSADTRAFLTGVAYNDLNRNGRYDVGEGIGGVTVTVAGVGSVQTWATGGYSFPVRPGTYTVTAQGPGLSSPYSQVVTVGSVNKRVDFTPSTIQFGSLVFRAQENAGSATITITRGGDAASAASVDYATADGSATAGSDYTAVSGTVQFGPGERARTFSVPLLDDPAREGGEVVRLTLSNPAGVDQLGGPSQAVLVIGDDEPNDDGLYVSALYRDLLGQPPPPDSLSTYQQQLDTARAAQLRPIAAGLLGTTEYRTRAITESYVQYIGRPPSAGELAGELDAWDPQVGAGGVAINLIGGAEGDDYWNLHPDPATGQPSNLSWLRAAFNDIYGRGPSSAEESTWLARLTSGAWDRYSVASDLWRSPEATARRVAAAFDQYLLRPADTAETSTWVYRLLYANTTPEAFVASLVGSSAYADLHGGTGASAIAALYQDLLGRPPSDTEAAAALDRVRSGYAAARREVAQSLMATPQYRARLVTAEYVRLLGAAPPPGTLNQLAARVGRGMTDEGLIATLAGSVAYYRDPARGNGSPATWVKAFYGDLFGRAPATPELNAQMGRLKRGASRASVVAALLASREWRTDLIAGHTDGSGGRIDGYYQTYYGRDPNGDEVARGLNEFGRGWADAQVIRDMLGAEEYFERSLD